MTLGATLPEKDLVTERSRCGGKSLCRLAKLSRRLLAVSYTISQPGRKVEQRLTSRSLGVPYG
jgi:hypothetical protein